MFLLSKERSCREERRGEVRERGERTVKKNGDRHLYIHTYYPHHCANGISGNHLRVGEREIRGEMR
jgi:hypothetical protein